MLHTRRETTGKEKRLTAVVLERLGTLFSRRSYGGEPLFLETKVYGWLE